VEIIGYSLSAIPAVSVIATGGVHAVMTARKGSGANLHLAGLLVRVQPGELYQR
jgi:hypothetical protein